MIERFLDGVTSLDVHGPDFRKKVDDIRTMGDEDIRTSASVSNTLLEKPLASIDPGWAHRGVHSSRHRCLHAATLLVGTSTDNAGATGQRRLPVRVHPSC